MAESKTVEFKFDVEVIEEGQRCSYGDSYYHYKVTSSLDEYVVRRFCMGCLRISYMKEEMPHPFVGELKQFQKIGPNTWEYMCESLYTG